MSDKAKYRVTRHDKALARWADYQAARPQLWARARKPWQQPGYRLNRRERVNFRRWLFWKQGGAYCAYCGRVMPLEWLTIDHIQPISKGGPVRDVRNMVLACLGCNRQKRDAWEDVYTTQQAYCANVV